MHRGLIRSRRCGTNELCGLILRTVVVDYDKTDIPASYDRARVRTPEVLELWMKTVSAHTPGRTIGAILDLGCGTGRFSPALASHFDARVIGIDPSRKMLAEARRKSTDPRIRYGLGRAEAIPLAADSVDLVFISMVFHHFDNPVAAARECRRVLREHAVLFLRAGTVEEISSYPYVRFFPTAVPILETRLNHRSFIRDTFEAAGFQAMECGLVTQEVAPSVAVYADQLATGADSILAALSPDEFAAGLRELRAYAARGAAGPVSETIDFFVFESRG